MGDGHKISTQQSGVRIIRRVLVCGNCGGAGRDAGPLYGRCLDCGGNGYPGGVVPESALVLR